MALRPGTIAYYRSAVNRFLRYLHTAYPQLHHAAQLRRDPHILGWLRSLGQEIPPLTNRSRRACLMCLRRLLDDLISNGQPLAEGMILRQDFPPRTSTYPSLCRRKTIACWNSNFAKPTNCMPPPCCFSGYGNAHRRVSSFANRLSAPSGS